MSSLLYRFTAFWAILWFVITMLLFYIPFWWVGRYPEPLRTQRFFRMTVLWMDIWFFFSGVRRTITGKNNFEKGKSYIVVCNHNSFMDVPLSSTCLPGPNKTIAKIEMIKVPVFGMVYKRGSVLVDRKSDTSRKQSFAKMKEVLAMGMHMCIYPEGTRNKGKEPLQPFYDGAFKLAVETKAPIIPCLIFNTAKVLPRNKGFYFRPHPVAMHFLEPVSPDGLKVDELRDRVYSVMEEHYVTHRS